MCKPMLTHESHLGSRHTIRKPNGSGFIRFRFQGYSTLFKTYEHPYQTLLKPASLIKSRTRSQVKEAGSLHFLYAPSQSTLNLILYFSIKPQTLLSTATSPF